MKPGSIVECINEFSEAKLAGAIGLPDKGDHDMVEKIINKGQYTYITLTGRTVIWQGKIMGMNIDYFKELLPAFDLEIAIKQEEYA